MSDRRPIAISEDLHLPLSAVTQKLAFLGTSGAGKTYAAGKFAEELLDAGAQVVILDTIGNWWGLRLGASGRTTHGISIPILGGMKGDIPLESLGGRQVAELIADSRASMIVDVSEFTKGELRRFVTDFAVALLRCKRKAPSPVMVIWEECQDIVPQRVMGDSAQMVGAVEALVKKGRNFGVGSCLLSQRSAAVNKDVLSQIDTLFAFRTIGTHDRKALSEWVTHQSIDVLEMFDELPRLPTGTCFCWSPQWLKVLQRVQIGKKRTFDATATPEFGDTERAGALAPVDLEKFQKTMASAIEKAQAADPEALRKRVAELERALKAAQSMAPAKVVVILDADLHRLEKSAARLTEEMNKLDAIAGTVMDEIQGVQETYADLRRAVAAAQQAPHAPTSSKSNGHVRTPVSASAPVDGDPALGRCAREILRALATDDTYTLTRTQAATLSGYSHRSSGFKNALSQLHAGGYITKNGNDVTATPQGAALAPPATARHPQDTLAMWSTKLGGKRGEMLSALVKAGRRGETREDLAKVVGLSPTSSGFKNYLSSLHANRLVEKEGDVVRAAAEVFG